MSCYLISLRRACSKLPLVDKVIHLPIELLGRQLTLPFRETAVQAAHTLSSMSTSGKTTISHEEAIEFVKKKLCIPDPKLNFGTLDRIQRNLMSEMPFQNISLIASPPERRFPTIEDVISDGLALRGGSCILNNWFLYLLLKAMGYDVFTIAATYCGIEDVPNGHMMVVAKGLLDPKEPKCKETLFLVDIASGYPLPGPVPLHRLPVSFPETAGLEVKIVKIDGLIYRLQHDQDPEPSEKHPIIDGWKVVIKFDLTPKEPLSLKEAMEANFCPDPPTPFLREVRMFRWPMEEDWCVGVRTNDLIFYGKECPEPDCNFNEKINKHRKTLKFEDLENVIKIYFPMICQNQLRIALQKMKELRETIEEEP